MDLGESDVVNVFFNVKVDMVLKSYEADGVNLLPEVLGVEGNFKKPINHVVIDH